MKLQYEKIPDEVKNASSGIFDWWKVSDTFIRVSDTFDLDFLKARNSGILMT